MEVLVREQPETRPARAALRRRPCDDGRGGSSSCARALRRQGETSAQEQIFVVRQEAPEPLALFNERCQIWPRGLHLRPTPFGVAHAHHVMAGLKPETTNSWNIQTAEENGRVHERFVIRSAEAVSVCRRARRRGRSSRASIPAAARCERRAGGARAPRA